MLILGPADSLSGSAGTGGAVACTVFGNAIAGGADSFRALYQGLLGTSAATLLSANDEQRLVKTISLANTSASDVANVRFFVGGTSAGNRIANLLIPAGGSAWLGGDGWFIYDSFGVRVVAPPASGASPSSYEDVLTSDFTTTSASADFTGLSFNVAAGENWNIGLLLVGQCSTANGIRVRVDAPAGSSLLVQGAANTSSATSYNTAQRITTPGGETLTIWSIAATECSLQALGSVRVGGLAGAVSVSVRPATSGDTATIRAGSLLSGRRQ